MKLEATCYKSDFGKRLYGLIMEKNNDADSVEDIIDSVKGLARKLFEQKLVIVNQNRERNFNSPDKDDDNAVGSIEKTILRHINTGILQDKKGQFVLAYCKFFNVSADYLYGLTDIRSPDVDVRTICKKTLLSEKAVKKLIERDPFDGIVDLREHSFSRQFWSDCWSLMIESGLFESLSSDWSALCREKQNYYHEEAEIKANEWIRDNIEDETLKYLHEGKLKTMYKSIESHLPAYYGFLAKISRDVSVCLDKAVDDIYNTEEHKSKELERAMSYAKELVDQMNSKQ